MFTMYLELFLLGVRCINVSVLRVITLIIALVVHLQPADKPLVVAHTKDDPHRDEGFVQKHEFSTTSSIQPNQQIYISLWAENKVIIVIISIYICVS